MKPLLTLHEAGRAGNGPALSEFDRIYKYEVLGLPPGEQAWIAFFKPVWRFLRVKDGIQGEWTGDFDSETAALAALQSEFDLVV